MKGMQAVVQTIQLVVVISAFIVRSRGSLERAEIAESRQPSCSRCALGGCRVRLRR